MLSEWHFPRNGSPSTRGSAVGRPCVRGLRIRVADVLDLLAAGLSNDEVLQELPDLEVEDIFACLRHARQRLSDPPTNSPQRSVVRCRGGWRPSAPRTLMLSGWRREAALHRSWPPGGAHRRGKTISRRDTTERARPPSGAAEPQGRGRHGPSARAARVPRSPAFHPWRPAASLIRARPNAHLPSARATLSAPVCIRW